MKSTPSGPCSLHTEPIPADPHKKLKANLAEFLLSLIQAFLRTGYYTSNHPEAKKAKLGLYEDFENLFTQKAELTFLVRDDPEGKHIIIEGVLPEIQSLNSAMLRGMAEMYAPKFAKFLEMLKKAEESPSDKNPHIEPPLFGALGFYENVEWPGVASLEDFLLETVDRRLSLGPLKLLKKKENPLNEGAIAAICESLGKIGTNESRATLQKLEKQSNRPWKNEAKEALIRIAQREAGKSPIKSP
jgi:hypothetical protein